MDTIVVFYSWTGHTQRLAQARAMQEGAQLSEVKDQKKPGTLKAYTAGCFAAMRMKRTPVQPFVAPLEDFDKIVIMAPVWAGHPAPAIYAAFDALPPGKQVAVCLVSGSGRSGCRQKIEALVKSKNCTLADWEDIRG